MRFEQVAVVRLVDLRGLLHRLGGEPDLVADQLLARRHAALGALGRDRVGVLEGDAGKRDGKLRRLLARFRGVHQHVGGLVWRSASESMCVLVLACSIRPRRAPRPARSRSKMRDRVGIVAQQDLLAPDWRDRDRSPPRRSGAAAACAGRPRPHSPDRRAECGCARRPRSAARIRFATSPFSSSAESGLRGLEHDGRDQRHRERRHDLADLAHQHLRRAARSRRSGAFSSSMRKSMPRSVTYWRSETGLPKLTQA